MKGIEMNDNTNTKTEELVPTPSLNDLQRLDQAKAVYTQSQEQVGDETEVANP